MAKKNTWGRAGDEDKRRGAALQAIRHATGKSVPKVADEIDPPLSASYLYMIENGRKPVPIKLCRRLAAFFGVPVEAITDPDYPVSAGQVCEVGQ